MPTSTDSTFLANDARWLPLHVERGAIQFVHLDREARAQLPFLTAEYVRELAPAPAVRTVAVADLPSIPEAPTPHFIFHSAFCCSTLLARALDIPGTATGLSEPQVLNELATAGRGGQLDEDLLRTVMALLGRPTAAGEAVVLKPSNVANLLARRLLETHPDSRALLLYAPLPQFLASVSRKGMWGRIWARRLQLLLSRDPGPQFGFSENARFEHTDLQVAALAWLHHHAHFAELTARFPDRVMTLDSKTFLADTAKGLAAVGEHFGLGLSPERWEQISESPVFSQDAKKIGQSFDGAVESSAAVASPLIDEEIDMIATWAATLALQIGLDANAPRPA